MSCFCRSSRSFVTRVRSEIMLQTREFTRRMWMSNLGAGAAECSKLSRTVWISSWPGPGRCTRERQSHTPHTGIRFKEANQCCHELTHLQPKELVVQRQQKGPHVFVRHDALQMNQSLCTRCKM